MIKGEPVYVGFSDEGQHIHQIISEEQLAGGKVYWHGYDVNYSRAYACYLIYNSGDTSMWNTPYWSRDPLPESYQHPERRRLSAMPEQFLENGSFLTWLAAQATLEEAGIAYCSRCKDYRSEDDPCRHSWWCETCGDFSKPGERCRHKRGA